MSDLHVRRGDAPSGPWALEIAPGRPGWTHTSLRILELPPGGVAAFALPGEELLLVPLSGSALVRCDSGEWELTGRRSAFDRVTDVVYLSTGMDVEIESRGGCRLALAGAVTDRHVPASYRGADEIAVEVRGAGNATRQVNALCMPGGLEADKLIVCEVLTPGGNWSSYPPHKHDTDVPGRECALEEIYYFELSRPGLAYHRVYGTPERPIDVLAEVGDGDVVLVPHGWHGPSIAAPGVDLYYLNVMAGPGPERSWLICDDPAHAWVRDSWADAPRDPRVPMTSVAGRVER